MSKGKCLLDAYRFPGFRPRATIKGIFGDPKARVIRLERRQKKQYAAVVADHIGVSTPESTDINAQTDMKNNQNHPLGWEKSLFTGSSISYGSFFCFANVNRNKI